jgi:hypothetical protein
MYVIQDSIVGILIAYGLDGLGFLSQYRQEILSVLKNVHTGSEVNLFSYSRDIEALSREKGSQGLMLTTHLHLAPKLPVSGATLLLLLYIRLASGAT